ncbi:MAG: hypothetical protein HY315_08715 [Acidobacteria bacterium]|nr:hypothetical protein [Acidobacteriota bacterium]
MRFLGGMVVALCGMLSLLALPEYLARFTADPMSSAPFKGRCSTCHINPAGGGPRNEFGLAFAANTFTITPELRARFPERFQYPVQSLDAHAEIHYSDPSGRTVILKRDGITTAIDPSSPPSAGAGLPVAAAPAAAAAATIEGAPAGRVSQWDRPMQLSTRWINLPQPAAISRNDANILIQHRFSAPLFVGSAPQLLGLDSTANIFLGLDYGVWDRLMVSLSRSRFNRNVEMDVTGDFWQQQRGAPLSLAGRIGLEGRDNFGEFFSPHLQLAAERQFGRRVAVLLAPALVFNSQDNRLFFLRDFAANSDKDYTLNMGVGLSLKVMPTFAVVAEYVPRLAGFRGYFVDRPAISVALQKQTFRHVFSLVISTSTAMTPAGYGPNIGADATPTANRLKLGFNILRKLR